MTITAEQIEAALAQSQHRAEASGTVLALLAELANNELAALGARGP